MRKKSRRGQRYERGGAVALCWRTTEHHLNKTRLQEMLNRPRVAVHNAAKSQCEDQGVDMAKAYWVNLVLEVHDPEKVAAYAALAGAAIEAAGGRLDDREIGGAGDGRCGDGGVVGGVGVGLIGGDAGVVGAFGHVPGGVVAIHVALGGDFGAAGVGGGGPELAGIVVGVGGVGIAGSEQDIFNRRLHRLRRF